MERGTAISERAELFTCQGNLARLRRGWWVGVPMGGLMWKNVVGNCTSVDEKFECMEP